jgi:hypothetical protein
MKRPVLVLLLALGACSEPSAPPPNPALKQRTLAEKILHRAVRVGSLPPEARKDVALALGEVALPTQSARLRLIVAAEDPILAAGAAQALTKTIARREGEAGLNDCARTETNEHVASACKAALAPEVAAAFDEKDLTARLSSSDVESRRSALRALLGRRGVPETGEELERALIHASTDADDRVALMTAAYQLRRSLAKFEPEVEMALPQGQMR